jgi:hypothetical protein
MPSRQLVESRDKDGNTPLHLATYGDMALVKELSMLSKELPDGLNPQNSEGKTPLHLAIRQGKIDMVKVLLEMGSNPAIPDCTGTNSLLLATQNDALPELIRAILRAHEPDSSFPRLSEDDRILAAAVASSSGENRRKAIRRDELELQNRAQEKRSSGVDGTTLLMVLAGISLNLRGGWDPMEDDPRFQENSYHSVSTHGDIGALKRRLTRQWNGGHNIDWRNTYTGYSALHDAVWNSSFPGVLLLLAAGADPTRKINRGRSPKDIADAIGNESVIALFGEGWKSAEWDKRTGWEWRLWAREIDKPFNRQHWGKVWSDDNP